MSDRARRVLWLIDQALVTRERHPSLFAAQLHARGKDRDVAQLAAAMDRFRAEKLSSSARPFRDDVEPMSAAAGHWTEESAGRLARDRLKADQRRQRQLAAMTVPALVAAAYAAAVVHSAVPAGAAERSRGGSDAAGPPRQQQLSDDPRWRLAEGVIRRQALVLHDLLSEQAGTGRAAAAAAMDSTDKDALILREGVGLTAEAVLDMLGREFGSASYVRRLRNARGLDSCGRPRLDS